MKNKKNQFELLRNLVLNTLRYTQNINISSVLFLFLIIFLLLACKGKDSPKKNSLSDKERMEWWTDARFGMFIHWGLYAQDGCFWKGLDGKSEHMMLKLEIPVAEYEKIATEFNPVKFNADEWVKIAKDAGMKYIVLTSKHHDGFAMYDSPSSDYNIVKRTLWNRDPVKELAEACEKQGLKFGLYYSLGRDWHHPHCNSRGGRRSNLWDYPKEEEKDLSIYFNEKVKPQITEIITQYKPAIIWFDTAEQITEEQSLELMNLIRRLDPACIVNSRVGNKLGDYAVKEQKIPAKGEPKPWETCMTISDVWGYHKMDDNWKATDSLIHSLVDITSKGGNFLLNVGPTGEGIIREPSVERLKAMGDWLKINGEAVYGTSSSPFGKLPWGRCTKKVGEAETTLYFTVFNWPPNGELKIPKLTNQVIESSLVETNGKIKTVTSAEGLHILLPEESPGMIAPVVKVRFKGKLIIK